MREKTSRPNWSVPNQFSKLGGSCIRSNALTTGLYGAITSAKTATRIMMTITTPPAAPSGLRRANCRAVDSQPRRSAWSVSSISVLASATIVIRDLPGSLALPDAAVEPRIHDVDKEIREYGDCDHQHDQRLGHCIIVVGDGRDEQFAEPVEVEHLLGDHQPSDQEREFDADDGDHRQ